MAKALPTLADLVDQRPPFLAAKQGWSPMADDPDQGSEFEEAGKQRHPFQGA
jgi:hypothetical protein